MKHLIFMIIAGCLLSCCFDDVDNAFAQNNKLPYVSASAIYCFSSDWPALDGQWEGIFAASDGKTYFGVSSHSREVHAQFFRYDPASNQIDHLGDMGEICGEKGQSKTPQGKIHTQMYEVDGRIYFGTMHGIYTDEAVANYPGGHLCSYDIESGTFEDHGIAREGEGLVPLIYDPVYDRFYSISWSGIGENHLIMFERPTGIFTDLGAFEPEGRVSRALMADPQGNIYGTHSGKIWKFNPEEGKQEFIKKKLPVAPYARDVDLYDEDLAPFNTMRFAIWDGETASFYVMLHVSELLFRFDPATMKIEPLGDFGLRQSKRRPASLGACLLGRKIYYTPWPDERAVNLKSYHIDTGKFADHGTIYVEGRKGLELHSLCAGGDGKLHGVIFANAAEEDIVPGRRTMGGGPFAMYFVVIDPEADLHK